MAFTRTPAGLVAKYRFYRVPTVWVEGPSDVSFYRPVLDGIAVRIEPFCGKDNGQQLIDALVHRDYPYVVVRDGDYDVLRRRRSVHRRVVMLDKYSFENYLWEKSILQEACLRYSNCGDSEDILRTDFEDALDAIGTKLYRLVILDAAARECATRVEVIPDRPERLLVGNRRVRFDDARIESLCSHAKTRLDERSVRRVAERIDEYLLSNRLVDILRGHFAFGLLRRLFIEAVRRKRKKNRLPKTKLWSRSCQC